jgi:hypothetical protein
MFDRIKKALRGDAKPAEAPASQLPSQLPQGAVSEWAVSQGFAVSYHGPGSNSPSRGAVMAVEGRVGSKPWRIELGKPTRNYILGEELRGRAELGLNDELAVMIMNRPLKEALEKKAYSMITDTLQTTADPNLPEEMRWLAMFDEVGWDSIPADFWERYAVLADRREHAMAWIDAPLVQQLMGWPEPAPTREVPFMVLILRGKAYLRMEYSPPEMGTLQHAARVFTSACESALGGFSAHVDLE